MAKVGSVQRVRSRAASIGQKNFLRRNTYKKFFFNFAEVTVSFIFLPDEDGALKNRQKTHKRVFLSILVPSFEDRRLKRVAQFRPPV